ncbi:hypothetical protein DICVIV_03128 [Dictyocaulus viviparus]|uniref:Piwi domain-containing protein n=1 Tax=Dictyocaulus viviparus TaxID=29172 RepID=A0A0D8Y1I1_DICVI|nr:hypothetical protein DICVIV_03128 [Dictyocaulus viviparus]
MISPTYNIIVVLLSSVRPNESGVLTWRLDQRLQFYRPATVEAISIVIFDRAIRDDQANSFYDVLTRAGRSRGMIVKNAGVIVNHLSSELESEIEDYFRRHAGKVSIIMFVTKDKKDIVHDFIKLLESKHKVVTQHVCKATVLSCIETRGGAKV